MSITNKPISPITARAGHFPYGWLLFLLSALGCPLAYGAGSPIYLRAEHITADPRTGKSIYQGKVQLKRGELSFVADRAIVTQRNSHIDTLTATGDPIVVRKSGRGKNTLTTVSGRHLTYLAKPNKVIITGKVITRQGSDVIKSAKVTYKIADDTIVAEGLGRSTRVNAVFQIKRLATPAPPPQGNRK